MDREKCVDLWKRLRRRFPLIAACILMPNHVHLIVLGPSPRRLKWKLGLELRAWTQRFHPGERIWAAVADPKAIPDVHHLKRQIRYVHLNPCRSRLVTDPLFWEWSTHRDVVGCVENPWPDREMLRSCFRTSDARLGETMHAYISGDPSVSVTGTPPLRPLCTGQTLATDLPSIQSLAAVALRESRTKASVRHLAIHVAESLRIRAEPELIGIGRRAWQKALKRTTSRLAIEAVLKLLGDARTRSDLRLDTTKVREMRT